MITIERIRNDEIFQRLNDDELRIVSQFCREETVPRDATNEETIGDAQFYP